jgi:hypothetical protein
VSVPSSEFGPPHPFSRKLVCPPRNQSGRGYTPLRVRRSGGSQFGRLEKKPSNLCTLWPLHYAFPCTYYLLPPLILTTVSYSTYMQMQYSSCTHGFWLLYSYNVHLFFPPLQPGTSYPPSHPDTESPQGGKRVKPIRHQIEFTPGTSQRPGGMDRVLAPTGFFLARLVAEYRGWGRGGGSCSVPATL